MIYMAVNQKTKNFWRLDSLEALKKLESRPSFEDYQGYRIQLAINEDGEVLMRDTTIEDLDSWQVIDSGYTGLSGVERAEMAHDLGERLTVVPESLGYRFTIADDCSPSLARNEAMTP